MKKIYLFTLILLFAPLAAHAAGGGACPSDAQYINPANPTGPLVTLASLGVTNCFYIAANGADSNPGTSEASPWQHAPGMPNCVGGSACHINPVAGQGFIFHGGDTWHYYAGSPQVGLPSGNAYAWDFHWSGTSSAEIYIGVDKNWSASTPWTRPIFTNDNPTSTSAVSSCAHPQGDMDDVVLDGVIHVQLDNFEFTGMCWSDSINNSNEHNYIKHFGQGPSYLTSFRTLSNMYWHGWTHTPFTPETCVAGSGSPRVCNGPGAVEGNTQRGEQGTLIVFNVCDGEDSDDLSFGCVAGDGYDVEENVFRHIGGTTILDNCHILANNLFEYINNSPDNSTHSDLWFCIGEYHSDNFFYNNLIRFVGTEYNRSLSTVLWLNNDNTSPSTTDYVFNNVEHDVNQCGNFNNFEAEVPGAKTLIYNNTMQSMNSCAVWQNGSNPGSGFAGAITEANNHYITGTNTGKTCQQAFSYPPVVNGGGACLDIFQTTAEANAQGYTSANDYAPTATSIATVGKGTNESGLSGTFGPAFLQSTTNGCGYNTVNHTVVCPAVTVGSRLSSGNWDAGAYISGSSANQPAAPSNLAATVNN